MERRVAGITAADVTSCMALIGANEVGHPTPHCAIFDEAPRRLGASIDVIVHICDHYRDLPAITNRLVS